MDYVVFYARKLREDNRYFAQQKMLIDSQLLASQELFRNMFKGDFKRQARAYLRQTGRL